MYHLYLDESGETGIDYANEEQPYFSISGFIVNESKVKDLGAEINRLKGEIGFSDNQELHANKIRQNERLALLYEKLMIIVEENCVGVVNTGINKKKVLDDMFILTKDGLKQIGEVSTKVIPYTYGAFLTLLKFNHFLKEKKSIGKVFFDEKVHGSPRVRKIFEEFYRGELLGKLISWDMLSIEYLKSEESTFIQLADVIAYTINKSETIALQANREYSDRDELIIKAYFDLQNYNVSSLEYDIGSILPAALLNDILKKIAKLILNIKQTK